MQIAKSTKPWRPYFTRSRTGCLFCRERRKKCDESRPSCYSCIRARRECVWSAEKPWLSDPSINTSSSSSASTPNTITSSSSSSYYYSRDISLVDLETICRKCPPISVPKPGTGLALESPDGMTNIASLFLDHYVRVTSGLMVARLKPHNPFITCIMPVAQVENLLMSAVLCLSGTHLCSQKGQMVTPLVQEATLCYYDRVVRGLRTVLVNNTGLDRMTTMSVILTLLLMCEIESIQRHHRGAIFPHLRALRHFVLLLQNNHNQNPGPSERMIEGFILETYAYFAIVANITPYGLDEARTIPFDPFLESLGEQLSGYDTFGVFFSSMHDLFSFIPRLSVLAQKRLVQHMTNEEADSLTQRFLNLQTEIQSWKHPSSKQQTALPSLSDISFPQLQGRILDDEILHPHIRYSWSAEHNIVAEIYRHALLVYLKASMCGPVMSSSSIRREIQAHADIMFPLLERASKSEFMAILLWPTMIVSSCLVVKSQQAMTRSQLQACRYNTDNVQQAIELLDRLWEDRAPEAFGPYGLYYVMKKSGINFCMS